MKQERNVDVKTVDGFGDEWLRFDQSDLAALEHKSLFNRYFCVFFYFNCTL